MKNFTKKQINLINLASDIILKEGVQGITIKKLASMAGISEPAIYRHFKSKFDILSSLILFFEACSDETITKIEKNRDSLKIFFLEHCKKFDKNRAFALVIFSDDLLTVDLNLKNQILSLMKERKEVIISFIKDLKLSNILRSDILDDDIFTIFIGTLRFIVTQWKLNNFSYNLEDVGIAIWDSIEKLLFIN